MQVTHHAKEEYIKDVMGKSITEVHDYGEVESLIKKDISKAYLIKKNHYLFHDTIFIVRGDRVITVFKD